jgi:ElaB/YqjD/DUF883 family membrane-anchored ribosome-binding protein
VNDNDSQTVAAPAAEGTDQLRADIQHARDQLGHTVEALVAKADVKGRAQQKVSEISGKLSDSLASPVAAISERASLPDPARKAMGQASSFVSKYRTQVAAAAAVLAGLLVIRRRRDR